MSDTVTPATPARKTTRRKTASVSVAIPTLDSVKATKAFEELFDDVIRNINEAKEEFFRLQKEIAATKEQWDKEKRTYEQLVVERNQQETVERKREQEAYEYEVAKKRQREEDEFLQKKLQWERNLEQRKEELAQEKKELQELREEVSEFESEKEKAVKEATTLVQKQLQETFTQERKLREQEIKAEKELLGLKIETFHKENTRQVQEIGALKTALDQATAQLKDVAVRVIESSNPKAPPPPKPAVE